MRHDLAELQWLRWCGRRLRRSGCGGWGFRDGERLDRVHLDFAPAALWGGEKWGRRQFHVVYVCGITGEFVGVDICRDRTLGRAIRRTLAT